VAWNGLGSDGANASILASRRVIRLHAGSVEVVHTPFISSERRYCMKPEYWLGIMAVVGAVIGAILGFIFPNPDTNYAVYGTALGIAAGLVIYTSQKSKASKKDQ
jgi:hypothetical protein